MCTLIFGDRSEILYAHNPMETSIDIVVQDEELHLRLEFPWSISNALQQHYPEFNDRTSPNEVLKALMDYVASRLVISCEGEVIPFANFKELSQDHSHSMSLELIYPADNLHELTIMNALLFDQYSQQANYHRIWLPDGTFRNYITSRAAASFMINTDIRAQ